MKRLKFYQSILDLSREPEPLARVVLTAFLVICALLIFLAIARAETAPPVCLSASWYSIKSLHREGQWKLTRGRCADGSMFNDSSLTCACRSYPLGSILRVTNTASGKTVVVRVTDRIGKRFAKTRIDLSRKAFSEIADIKQGIVTVKIEGKAK